MFDRRFAMKLFLVSPFLNFTKLFAENHLEFTGKVFVNGKAMTHQTKIKKGDTIETFKGASARFKFHKDAFLLRENSTFKIENTQSKVFTLLTGGVLAVFGKGKATLKTSTVAAGIRGTGMYVEIEDSSTTYVCTCYGEINYDFAGGNEMVGATHHDRPLRFFKKGGRVSFKKAPMEKHTDDELIQLEQMHDRLPPFVKSADVFIENMKNFFGRRT